MKINEKADVVEITEGNITYAASREA